MNKAMVLCVLCLLSLVTAVCLFPAAAAAAVNLDLSGTTGLALEWKDWKDPQEGESGTPGDELLLESEINLDLKLTSADQTSCFLSLLYKTGEAKVEIEEGYLEHNPNPNLLLRIGRQKVSGERASVGIPPTTLCRQRRPRRKG